MSLLSLACIRINMKSNKEHNNRGVGRNEKEGKNLLSINFMCTIFSEGVVD